MSIQKRFAVGTKEAGARAANLVASRCANGSGINGNLFVIKGFKHGGPIASSLAFGGGRFASASGAAR